MPRRYHQHRRGQMPKLGREPEYDAHEIASSAREYILLSLEQQHVRERYMPLVYSWFHWALKQQGSHEVKAAMRSALQCWRCEQLAPSPEYACEMQFQTDMALDAVFQATPLPLVFGSQ